MRVIKFKGKKVNGGDWVTSMTISIGTIERKRHNMFFEIGENKWVGVVPETVGQFTGFVDDQNRDIYEGDLVKFGAQYESIGEVKYIVRNGGYLVKDKWGDWQWLYDIVASTNCIVIGNIYDNPKLLDCSSPQASV